MATSLFDLYKNLSGVKKLQKEVYSDSPSKKPLTRAKQSSVRNNTTAILGAVLGDEGKGRVVLNTIESYLKQKNIKVVYVIRFQGGSNAGHTLQIGKTKWAQHQVPSGVHLKGVVGVMDTGMVIHPEDLMHEVKLIEKTTKTTIDENKLIVSQDATIVTDLDRAKEVINRYLSTGSKGGTGRGIGPAYASHYDRLGYTISDLLNDDWEKTFRDKYRYMKKLSLSFGYNLSSIEVPDFNNTKRKSTAITRKLETEKIFLSRLKKARNFLKQRKLVSNTFPTYVDQYPNSKTAFVFEGAQAIGLDAWVGTRPDITASNTTLSGITQSTKFWQPSQIQNVIGVIKATYTSSVGSRIMPTHIDLPFPIPDEIILDDDQQTARYIRAEANEYGSTTGRPRDINYLDLEFIGYNLKIGGVRSLVATHLDIAKEDVPIKIGVGYKNKSGESIHYQPGLKYQEDVTPVYIELPGWSGEVVSRSKKASDLPENAIKFIRFLEKMLDTPMLAVTTGPKMKDIIYL